MPHRLQFLGLPGSLIPVLSVGITILPQVFQLLSVAEYIFVRIFRAGPATSPSCDFRLRSFFGLRVLLPSWLICATSARAFLASAMSGPSKFGWFSLQNWILFSFFPHGMLMLLLLHLSRGGVSGLTLASALSKSPDICVHVYEAASKSTEIDAGIGV